MTRFDTSMKEMAMILESERLIFRQWKSKDLKPFFDLNSDLEVMEFFPSPLTRNESDEMAHKCMSLIEHQGYGFFAAELKSTQEFIGFIGLHSPDYLPFSPCIEIGWRLDKNFWRQGYATEGALAVLNYGFETLKCREIVSFTSCINLASIAVMKRIGMQYVVDGDFDHPNLERGHALCRHVLYRISNPKS